MKLIANSKSTIYRMIRELVRLGLLSVTLAPHPAKGKEATGGRQHMLLKTKDLDKSIEFIRKNLVSEKKAKKINPPRGGGEGQGGLLREPLLVPSPLMRGKPKVLNAPASANSHFRADQFPIPISMIIEMRLFPLPPPPFPSPASFPAPFPPHPPYYTPFFTSQPYPSSPQYPLPLSPSSLPPYISPLVSSQRFCVTETGELLFAKKAYVESPGETGGFSSALEAVSVGDRRLPHGEAVRVTETPPSQAAPPAAASRARAYDGEPNSSRSDASERNPEPTALADSSETGQRSPRTRRNGSGDTEGAGDAQRLAVGLVCAQFDDHRNTEPSEEAIDPEDLVRIYNRAKGTKKLNKSERTLLEQFLADGVDLSEAKEALERFLEDEYWRERRFPIRAFIRQYSHFRKSELGIGKNPKVVIGTKPKVGIGKNQKLGIGKNSTAPNPVLQGLIAKWNKKVPARKAENVDERYDRKLVEEALADERFTSRFDEIADRCRQIVYSRLDDTEWMTFRWLLKVKDGRPNWWAVLSGDYDWMIDRNRELHEDEVDIPEYDPNVTGTVEGLPIRRLLKQVDDPEYQALRQQHIHLYAEVRLAAQRIMKDKIEEEVRQRMPKEIVEATRARELKTAEDVRAFSAAMDEFRRTWAEIECAVIDRYSRIGFLNVLKRKGIPVKQEWYPPKD
jgi:hypothetical protein